MKDKIKEEIKNALEDQYINFEDWAKSNDIYSHLTKLIPEVWGFVYKSIYDNYFVIINKNLTRQMQQEVFMH
ncbi:hypothetical protein [Fuchsiella alkaliacetigena]|uniref:hypothetical protein n=1 Tax=Fuchsiella alkaliacetigena TaxID=957042 RepID=UPI00200AC337|nr:hypothetical protein [Fuchsiella alkaliacetigena]MCK8826031.1 hypothetical protein [Fuchsiella alkaliacetigena]